MTRILIACFAMLLLAGCYESNSMLLDASQSRQPITGHQDWNYGSAGHRYHARLNPRSDGWYDYEEAQINDNGSEGDWKHHTVLLNYLESASGYDIYVYGTWDESEHAYAYGVVAVGANGFWQSISPSCDPMGADEQWYQPDLNAAKQAGAEVKTIDDAQDVCWFTSQATLFNAMRNVVAQPGFADRVQKART